MACIVIDAEGNLRPSLTALSWAWFDAQDPANFSSPTDQGELEVTDVDALLTIELANTTLLEGQTGTLVLRSDDGLLYGAYNVQVAF